MPIPECHTEPDLVDCSAFPSSLAGMPLLPYSDSVVLTNQVHCEVVYHGGQNSSWQIGWTLHCALCEAMHLAGAFGDI